MKISNSKKELAKIVSENGGYQSGNFCAQQDDGEVWFSKEKPAWKKGRGVFAMDYENHITIGNLISNRHQAILSRTEYFHLYPAPDADGWIEWNGGECPVGGGVVVDLKWSDGFEPKAAKPEVFRWQHLDSHANIIAYRLHKPEQSTVESRLADAVDIVKSAAPALMRDDMKFNGDEVMGERKPTIEQLAADYRNKLAYADRKQDEANKAKSESDAAFSELEKVIAAIGFAITPICAVVQEPELVITDWRDLRIGDVIWVDGYDGHNSNEVVVVYMEGNDSDARYAVAVAGGEVFEEFEVFVRWIDVCKGWRFVRRPAK
ncbi:MAG: hypothetical protein ACRDA8_18060 [Shewanella sp.]